MGNCLDHPKTRNIPMYDKDLNTLTLDNTPAYDWSDIKYAKVLKVYDGDTVTIGVIHPLTKIPCRYSVRLYGVDCPEIKGGDAISKNRANESKMFISNKILNTIVKIDIKNNTYTGGKLITEKYGRILANIYTLDGCCINDELIRLNLAKSYFGGTK